MKMKVALWLDKGTVVDRCHVPATTDTPARKGLTTIIASYSATNVLEQVDIVQNDVVVSFNSGSGLVLGEKGFLDLLGGVRSDCKNTDVE